MPDLSKALAEAVKLSYRAVWTWVYGNVPFNNWPAHDTPLALSARILAHLARRARVPAPGMASTIIAEPSSMLGIVQKPDIFIEPPAVITTPCDPWPRPYFLEDGLRKVHPYHYTYNTYCKERWRGRELLDIFATEFRDRPTEYYVNTSTRSWYPPVLTNLRKTP